jgi:hypothetical protein
MNQLEEIRNIWCMMVIVGYILEQWGMKISRSIMTRLALTLLEAEIGLGNTLLYILLGGLVGTYFGS